MSKEPEHTDDETPADNPHQAAANARAGWMLIGGFILVLSLLVGAEFFRG